MEEQVAYVRQSRSIEHELAHLVASSAMGTPNDYLAESLAEFFGGSTASAWSQADNAKDPRLEVDLDSNEIDYASAAYFAQFLVDRYGMSGLIDLYRANAEGGFGTFSETFERVLGSEFDDFAMEFMAEPSYCVRPTFDCAVGEAMQVDGGLALEFAMGCESPEATGYSFAHDDSLELQVADAFMVGLRADFGQAGTYRLSRVSPHTWLSGCSTCRHVQLSREVETFAEIERGLSVVRFLGSSEGGKSAWVELTIERAPTRGGE